LIASAALVDLQGPKMLAQESFYQRVPDMSMVNSALERFYAAVESGAPEGFVRSRIDSQEAFVSRIGETTVIVVFSDRTGFDEVDAASVKALNTAFNWLVGDGSVRAKKDEFGSLVRRHLLRPARLCLITDDSFSADNVSGGAILQIVGSMGQRTPQPIQMGPYNVSVWHYTFDSFTWSDELGDMDAFAFVASPETEESHYSRVVNTIRSHRPSVTVMVIPSSDDQLEFARQIEERFEIVLCDAVSGVPSELILCVMCTAMMTDMHPELAQETWRIDHSIDRRKIESRAVGHQAFFVIDKKTGRAVYSFYYETKSKVLERAPNVIAAISMFRLDTTLSGKTSVFRAGDLNYIIIERENLVFTLITGDEQNVEELRKKFSFLPDLWADEEPENVECTEDDLYTSPPFTLKLLATLPPESLLPKMVPVRVEEPDWNRFRSELVRDFLQAVWGSLDGTLDIGKLAVGDGPKMTLGAIHLLKRLGAIRLRIVVSPEDRPRLTGHLDAGLRSLYENIDRIVGEADGKNSISDISERLGIETNVLITVFAELYRRGIVTFDT